MRSDGELPYARTYSSDGQVEVQQAWTSGATTLNDYAIACALEEDARSVPPPEDTSMDRALAVTMYNSDVDRLCGEEPVIWQDAPTSRALLDRVSWGRIQQLIPRLNCFSAPSPEFVSADRERLLLRLDFYGLEEREVQGDGSCQFRALSEQLFRSEDHHALVRRRVVAQLQQHPELYRDYVTTEYAAYCRAMARPGTWGDHVTLKAASDAYGIPICVVSSFLQDCVISIQPAELSAAGRKRTLWLSFFAEVHYNSIYPKSL